MNIARSSFKLFAANVANAGIQFIGIVYFARELGATQMGIFFLFQVVLGLLAIPADFGLRGAVQKRISEGQSQGKFLSSAIALKIIPITVIILGILLVQPYLNSYIGAKVTNFVVLALILQESAKLSVAVLEGELRVGETAVLKVARNITWVVVGSALIKFGFEAEGLIYGLVAGLGVVTVWGWIKLSVSPTMPSVSHAQSLFDYGKYNAISSVGGFLYSWTDVAVIGIFLTQAHVGAYEIAWRVSAISILFSQALASTIFPQVSQWNAEDAQNRIENLIAKSLAPSLFLVIPAFFGTLLFSEEILGIVFGDEFTLAATVLILLMSDKIFQSIQLIVGRSLQAIDKPNLAAQAAIASLGVNIVLNVIFVIKFGLIGAAVATVISSLLNDFLHLVYLRRFVSVRFPHREILECMFASGVMTTVLYGITMIYQFKTLPELFAVLFLGVLVYGSAVLLMPNLRVRVFEALERVGLYP